MIYTIKNEKLTVSVDSHGAELCAIIGADGVHYLYEGNPTYWKDKAPILFPIVGKLQDGKYRYQDGTYELGGHGFARHSEFTVTVQTEDTLTMTLCDSPETLKVYPFQFRLDIIFELAGGTLFVKNVVTNNSDGEMLFSIGAHEGYNCPLVDGETFTDYDIVFDRKETAGSWCINLSNGLRYGNQYPLLENSDTLPLKYDYFNTDAIVLIGQKSRSATLKSRKSGKGVEVCFPGFPMLGIWQKPGSPYVCIEPWCGVCDLDGFTGDLSQKDGIIRLDKGEVYSNVHSIRPF